MAGTGVALFSALTVATTLVSNGSFGNKFRSNAVDARLQAPISEDPIMATTNLRFFSSVSTPTQETMFRFSLIPRILVESCFSGIPPNGVPEGTLPTNSKLEQSNAITVQNAAWLDSILLNS